MSHNKKENIYYLDVLRVLAIFGVVLSHVSSATGYMSAPLNSLKWWVGALGVSSTRWCIPVFVMISGALLLDPARQESAKRFYQKRLRRVLVPIVFWTFFYLAMDNFSIELLPRDVIRSVLRGEPKYHLWYLYMIPGLYLLTPFLRTYIKYSSARERNFLIAVIFLLANCYYPINSLLFRNQNTIFTGFIPYLAYYLCGYQLRLMNPQRASPLLLIIIIIACTVVIAGGTASIMILFNMKQCVFLYGYLLLPVVLMSIAVFLLIYRLDYYGSLSYRKMVTLVESITPTTLGIYVMHVALLDVTIRLIKQPVFSSHFMSSILGVTLIVFFVGYVISVVVMKIPYLRRVIA